MLILVQRLLQKLIKPIVGIFLVGITSSAVAQQPGYLADPKPLDPQGFQEIFVQVAPNIYMSGQPSEEGLERIKAMGVTKVVNLRTSFEMDNREVVPFDEAAKLAQLDINYVHLPLGGPNTPYDAAALDKFAAAINMDEKILLHCTVAWRASHLWTAYLIKHQKVPFPQAIATGQQLNLGQLPLSGFLGQELTITPLNK